MSTKYVYDSQKTCLTVTLARPDIAKALLNETPASGSAGKLAMAAEGLLFVYSQYGRAVHAEVCVCVYFSVCLCVYVSVCLCVCVCLSVCLSV